MAEEMKQEETINQGEETKKADCEQAECTEETVNQTDETPDPATQTDETADKSNELLEKMEQIEQKVDSLSEKFDDKIQTDTYKNQLFDQMHSQLRKYQEDVLEAIREPIISELLDLLDGLKKYEKHMPEEATQENMEKLKRRFSDVREDLEDILENLDVCRYETDPEQPEPKRQKIIKTVQTAQPEQNNQIAEKLADGYLYKNRILKYEKVAIYKYKDSAEDAQ